MSENENGIKKVNRRDALTALGAFGALFAVGGAAAACSGGSAETNDADGGAGTSSTSSTSSSSSSSSSGSTADATTTSSSSSSSSSGSTTDCTVIPDETEGPYPDKTGMISNASFNRSDITEGKTGLALTVTFTVVNTNSACAAVENATVIIWHCDDVGDYSEYSQPGYDGTGKTFLRGYQVTGADGKVTFKTIYPGWYSGRATHIHMEVYVDGKSVKVTQMAFPEATTNTVYSQGTYAAHGQSTTSNANDMVFEDGILTQLANVGGDTTSGMTAQLNIGVAV